MIILVNCFCTAVLSSRWWPRWLLMPSSIDRVVKLWYGDPIFWGLLLENVTLLLLMQAIIHLVTKENPVQNIQRTYMWKERTKVSRFLREKISEIALFKQQASASPKYTAGFINFLLYSLIYSQIWLIPLVYDCWYGYIARLEQKNPDIAQHQIY